jgi:hypothetical protein
MRLIADYILHGCSVASTQPPELCSASGVKHCMPLHACRRWQKNCYGDVANTHTLSMSGVHWHRCFGGRIRYWSARSKRANCAWPASVASCRTVAAQPAVCCRSCNCAEETAPPAAGWRRRHQPASWRRNWVPCSVRQLTAAVSTASPESEITGGLWGHRHRQQRRSYRAAHSTRTPQRHSAPTIA